MIGWVRLNALGRSLYPTLRWGQPYRVMAEEAFGWWIEAPGDPFLSPGQRFVFKTHFEEAPTPEA
jgi:hypothetical protein